MQLSLSSHSFESLYQYIEVVVQTIITCIQHIEGAGSVIINISFRKEIGWIQYAFSDLWQFSAGIRQWSITHYGAITGQYLEKI